MLDAPADRIAMATAQLDAVAAAYARATEIVRPLMEAAPDGCVVVGAMDGWTAAIPKPDFPPADGLEPRGASPSSPTRRTRATGRRTGSQGASEGWMPTPMGGGGVVGPSRWGGNTGGEVAVAVQV